MKLSIISEERIKDAGKCKSCKWNYSWQEYDIWESDCSQPLLEKLMFGLKENEEIEYGDEIGFNKICPIWEPKTLDLCKTHGLFFDEKGCQECEYESIIKAEKLGEEYFSFG